MRRQVWGSATSRLIQISARGLLHAVVRQVANKFQQRAGPLRPPPGRGRGAKSARRDAYSVAY